MKSKSTRPPIVVVMGHIDHGKSTLLDHIRKTNVVAGEAGGITQAVSAYEAGGITFIDTPGHAAFAGMRGRGATIADIAILVVSAEEGVKPQTLEALADIAAAGLPFIVAINKIDRPNANSEMVKQQLAEKNILLEGYGGTISAVEISAKTGQGVPELLELLALQAELQNLAATPETPAEGLVLESHIDARSGASATLIIKNGTLHLGDFLVIGGAVSKIKRLNNSLDESVAFLPPSSPAFLAGLAALPTVGASFRAFGDKKSADDYAEQNKSERNQKEKIVASETGETKLEIPLVLKADRSGALEALAAEVAKLETAEIKLKIIAQSAGRITDNDIKLASTTVGSIVLGFNTKSEKSVADLAEKLKVEVVTFDIIYKLAEWLEAKIKERQPSTEVALATGKAKIIKIFSAAKGRQVLGGAVSEGKIVVGKKVKIFRRDNEITTGKIVELQQQKAAAKEVTAPNQFGALIEAKIPLVAGDTFELYEDAPRR